MPLTEKNVFVDTPEPTLAPLEIGKVKKPSNQGSAKAVWGPVASLLFGMLGAFIGGSVIASILVMLVLTVLGFDAAEIDVWSRTINGVLVVSALAAVFVIAVILLYVKRRGGNKLQLGLTKFHLHYVWQAISGVLTYFFMYVVAVSIIKVLVPSLDLEQKQDLGFDSPVSSFQLVAVFLTLVVIPPIVEELVFRGFIYSGLRSRFNFAIATLVTSLFFAVGHLQFGNGAPLLWVAAIDTFVLSVVMCYIRERTGSIIPTIIIHALKNGLAFSFLYLAPFVR